MTKKEKRAYFVPHQTLDEIIGDSGKDYDSISDGRWKELAEEDGWVYTIDGFFTEWNSDWWQFPNRDFTAVRLIDVITYE